MNYYEEFETSYQTLTYMHWINQFKMGVPRKIFWMRHCRTHMYLCTDNIQYRFTWREWERESDRNSWKMLKGGCRIFDVYRKNKHS